MKKRLRKKWHRGEFKQIGCSVLIPVTLESVDVILDQLTEIAEANNLIFIGGGLGRIVLPSDKYEDRIIPRKVEVLIRGLAFQTDLCKDCILGYFVDFTHRKVIGNKMEIQTQLESLNPEYKVNWEVDLWGG